MKSKLSVTVAFGLLAAVPLSSAFAYPVLDQIVPTGGESISVYPDHQTPGVYWYIPQSIEPWGSDDRYQSVIYKTPNVLSFVFRGQASVDEDTLKRVAAAIGTSRSNLTPIAYDSSKDFACQNIWSDNAGVKWLFPQMIGNYFEIVPVSLRISDPSIIDEADALLTSPGGLACTVTVSFKAVSSGYKLSFSSNFTQIYSRFEMDAHAEGLWWEVDIHTMVERLIRDHVILIRSLEDATIPQSELDKKIQSAMDAIVAQITAKIFTPALKIPNEPMAGRGKPWSLRVDYRRSEEDDHYYAALDSQKVQSKETQISVHLVGKNGNF